MLDAPTVRITDANGVDVTMRNLDTLGKRTARLDGAWFGFGGSGAAFGETAFDGASITEPDVRGWQPYNISPNQALARERGRLAARVHHVTRNDGWAAASTDRKVDSIIGDGWRLTSKPNAKALGISPADADELGQQIEAAWRLYTTSEENYCDLGERMNMGAMMALAFRHRMIDGEALALIHWRPGRGSDYATCIQVVDPDRLSNPLNRPDSYLQRQGIDLNNDGVPISYNFRRSHPGDIGLINPEWLKWDTVARKLPNGRRQVVHAFEPASAAMVRGIPVLAPVLQKLHMLGRFDKAELQSSVLNAILAATVTSPNDPDQIAASFSPANDDTELSALQQDRMNFYQDRAVKMDGAVINYMYPSDKLDLTKPQHPNPGYEAFTRAALRNIAAATGTSYEQLTTDWSQSNYSSARGALIEVWRGFTARGGNWGAQFLLPIYGAWLEEAIAIGNVKPPKNAPPFRAARAAYCQANWIGPPRGHIDPLKEAQAALIRISGGLSTYEIECGEYGHWYQDIFRQRARERDEQNALGLDPDALLRSAMPRGTQTPINPPAPIEPGTEGSAPSDKQTNDQPSGGEA